MSHSATEILRAARRARTNPSDRALPRLTRRARDGADRGGTTVGHPAERRGSRTWPRAWTPTSTPWPPSGAGYSADTPWSTSRTRWSAWAASACAPTSPCARAAPRTTCVFLQLKQARRSVVAPFVHGESAWHAHQGQRVVEYQQALQTVSDPLLGWTTVQDRQYYVRQFRNMKGTISVDALDSRALADYAGICGRLLAKAHARTSGASMIAGYAGSSGSWTMPCAASRGCTPTRPNGTTRAWSGLSPRVCSPPSRRRETPRGRLTRGAVTSSARPVR